MKLVALVSNRTRLLSFLLTSSLLLTAPNALANWGDVTSWKSDAGDGDWNDTHWYDVTQGWDNHNPNYEGYRDLTFDNNNQTTMNNDFSGNGTNMWRITFSSNATLARTIGGSTENSFQVVSSTIPRIQNDSAANHTINFPMRIGYSGGMEINPVVGDMTIGGDIDNNGYDVHVYGDNQNSLTLSGVVSGGGKLIVEQYSKVIISGSSTFSGDVEIDEGELRIDQGGSLSSGRIYVGNSGQQTDTTKLLIVDSNGGTAVDEDITVRQSGGAQYRVIGAAHGSGTTNTFSGDITLASSFMQVTQASGGVVVFSGAIGESGGSQGITKVGDGQARLAGNSTYSGQTSVDDGILSLDAADRISDSSGLYVASGATFALSNFNETVAYIDGTGTIALGSADLIANQGVAKTYSGAITGTGSFVKKGSGILTLDNTGPGYSGSTYVVGSELRYNVSPGAGYSGTIYLGETNGSDEATLGIGVGGVTVANDITVRSGSSGTKFIVANNSSGVATFSGDVTMQDPVSLRATIGTGTLVMGDIAMGANNLYAENFNDLTVGAVTGSGILQKSTGYGGTLIITGACNYGDTYFNDGTIRIAAGGDIQGGTFHLGSNVHQNDTILELAADGLDINRTIDVEDAGGIEVKTISCTAAGTTTLSGTINLRNQDLILTASSGGTLALTSTLDMNVLAGDMDLIVQGDGDTTISGTIDADSGNSEIKKQGAGTLTLSGDNSGKSWMLRPSAGTAYLNSANALGTAYSDKIQFDGSATLRVGQTMAPASLGMKINGDYTSTFNVDNGVTFTVPGVIDDGGNTANVVKSGTGTLVLQSINTIDGNTTVEAGTLKMDSGSSIGPTFTVNQDGTVAGQGTVGKLAVYGSVAPGASVGTIEAGYTTWQTNGTYVWEINDFNGTYGTDPGWDKLNITGDLTNSATAANPFTIRIASLNGSNPGDAANFDNTKGWTGEIATVSGSIVGFDSTKFQVDMSSFSNDAARGTFYVSTNASSILLYFEVATYEWDAGGGADTDWSNGTNWTADAEPDTGSTAYVSGGYTAVVSEADEVAYKLFVGDDTGEQGTLNISSGGSLAIHNELRLGNSANATGTVNVTGGLLDVATNGTPALTVGYEGQGVLTISGVSTVRVNAAADLVIGDSSSDDNAVNVHGGLLDVGDNIIIGNNLFTSGKLSVTNGTVTVADNLQIGDAAAATGTVSVSGGSVTVGANMAVGNAGLGTITVSGGAVTAATIRVSDTSAGDGSSLTVSGGRVTTSGGGNFTVDYDGTVNVSSGELVGDIFYMGVAGEATVNLSGGTIQAENDFNVGGGDGGTGRLTQTGGTLDINGNNPLNIGGQGSTNRFGYYTITNGVIDMNAGGDASDLLIGETATGGGTGVFHVVGGKPSITVGDDLQLSSHTNSVLAVTIVDDDLATIQVTDDIKIDGALSVSNVGATVAAGTYVVATSLNASAVSGVFNTTNWLGTVEGRVFYDDYRVSVMFGAEMGVLGTNVSQSVTNNDDSATTADGTDFGTVRMPAYTEHTFTITNRDSTYTLSLSGSPLVDISGVHSDDYSVVTAPVASIPPNSNTTLKIRFTPSDAGVRTALVSIANNDAAANPYTFTINGTGEFAPEPTMHASNLVFKAVTNVQMKVCWDKGNGTNRIVVAKQGTAVSNDPVDGSNYTDNAAFGSGHTVGAGEFVIYNGTETSVVMTALSPGTTYYFKVFEYNGTSYGVNYYTTDTPLNGNQATASYAPVITEGVSTNITMSENGNTAVFTLHATDADPGDTITWSIKNAAFHGTATVSGTGTSKAVSYTPPLYFSGSDSFIVQVKDTYGNTDSITVLVKVNAVNVPGKAVFIFE
jgi:autotransporter-associated beta strand protein